MILYTVNFMIQISDNYDEENNKIIDDPHSEIEILLYN